MTKKTWLAAAFAAILSVVGWNSAWRYDEGDVLLGSSRLHTKIRSHLITGEAQYLGSGGWTTIR